MGRSWFSAPEFHPFRWRNYRFLPTLRPPPLPSALSPSQVKALVQHYLLDDQLRYDPACFDYRTFIVLLSTPSLHLTGTSLLYLMLPYGGFALDIPPSAFRVFSVLAKPIRPPFCSFWLPLFLVSALSFLQIQTSHSPPLLKTFPTYFAMHIQPFAPSMHAA